MPSEAGVRANQGVVVSVGGSVVDIRFDEHLPPIHSLLRAGEGGRIVLEVLAQRDARHVRRTAASRRSEPLSVFVERHAEEVGHHS